MSQTKYQLQSLPKLVHPAHIGLAGISVEISSFFFFLARAPYSLVPRPHPLTRRNGLVNQVEFLGLAGALATL